MGHLYAIYTENWLLCIKDLNALEKNLGPCTF